MRGRDLDERLKAIETQLEKLDHSIDRIELVTVVREPNTGMSADAYNGLRKQVIAAVNERVAHLGQLAQFDAAMRTGASGEELTALSREWLEQSGLERVDDMAVAEAFEMVGPEDATGQRLLRPAYIDTASGRVIRGGVIERVHEPPPPTAEPELSEIDGEEDGPTELAADELPTPGGQA
jgi:hypothetical protein